MATLVEKKKETYSLTNEDFEKYLTDQKSNATFNGIEVEEFAWYKKLLGFKA